MACNLSESRLPSYDPRNDVEEEEELPRYEQPPQRNPDGTVVLQPGEFGEHTEAQSAAFAGEEMYEENQYGEIVHCDSPAARRWGDGRADGSLREQPAEGGNLTTRFKGMSIHPSYTPADTLILSLLASTGILKGKRSST